MSLPVPLALTAFAARISAFKLLSIFVIFALAACRTRPEPPPPAGFERTDWEAVGAFSDDGDLASLRAALDASAGWARTQLAAKPERDAAFGPARIPLARIESALSRLAAAATQAKDMAAYTARVKAEFTPWRARAAEGKSLLVTGYYIPVIDGSLVADALHTVPVYGVPSDLVTASLGEFLDSLAGKTVRGRVDGNRFVPYFTRNEIREGRALEGRAEILAWARTEWDPFVVEVQGSGVLRLPDGTEKLVAYADQNGRGYRAVGKILLDEKKIPKEKMSMQAIGRYVAENPQELRRVLDSNPSFVFFRLGEGRARGSLGFPLTPGRSVAVDMKSFPQGAAALLRTQIPDRTANGDVVSAGALARFVVNQDTGGAIRGLDRADFFWGQGAEAGERAGAMQHAGEYFLLLPKDESPLPVAER